MAIEILMPALSPTMETGTLATGMSRSATRCEAAM
ncbi:MAG: hypothetical protein CM15mP115_23430 [Alphaproteobacteria bacterium]|nr:MAG: hypothetical protein CM15mP115_23430 [Alphaproteobacteria bacterium]